MLDDGECLWAQAEQGGPAVRVGPEGVHLRAWTEGLWLAATGPGSAWFCSGPPEQELVHGPNASVAPHDVVDTLLRIDAAGRRDTVYVDSRVHDVLPGPDSLLVRAESGGHELVHLGCDTYEVDRATHWLELPWDAALPDTLSASEHAAGVAPTRQWVEGGRRASPWHDHASEAVEAAGLSWRSDWDIDNSNPVRQALVTAHDANGSLAGRWDLGAGQVPALIPFAGGVAFVVARPSPVAPREPGPVEVLALRPGETRPRTLFAGSLDISAQVRLARPIEIDSYLSAMIARYPVPDLTGVVADGARLVGAWPDTRLEWTFTHPSRPGITLRRRLALFDDLGRICEPEYCDIHLMEDLDTGGLPPAGDARDGVLDI